MDMSTTTKDAGQRGSWWGRLDYSEAEQLIRQGHPHKDVAAALGVTPSAITKAIERGNIKVSPKQLRGQLPWDVRPEHNNLAVPRMLRIALRLEAGLPVGRTLQAQGQGFLNQLRDNGLVIHYEPDIPPHWFRVPAREGIDVGLVRLPDDMIDN